jgi:hypothetical protein
MPKHTRADEHVQFNPLASQNNNHSHTHAHMHKAHGARCATRDTRHSHMHTTRDTRTCTRHKTHDKTTPRQTNAKQTIAFTRDVAVIAVTHMHAHHNNNQNACTHTHTHTHTTPSTSLLWTATTNTHTNRLPPCRLTRGSPPKYRALFFCVAFCLVRTMAGLCESTGPIPFCYQSNIPPSLFRTAQTRHHANTPHTITL